jgi:hypothetical protein
MPLQTFAVLDSVKRAVISGHQQCGSLEVFHLQWPVGNGPAYVTLDEALASHWIEIAESTESGQVSKIKIINHSEHMIFLMAGEQLVGCKQNRVLNSSIMVPPKAEMPLAVTCVERGRWGYSSGAFSSAGTSSYYGLRAMMSGHAHQGYRSSGMPVSDQREVWGEVSRKIDAMRSPSRSDAMQDVYRNHAVKLKELEEKVPAPTDCNAAVFVVAGMVVGSDFFDKKETLQKLWPKLIRSCSLDALEQQTQNVRSTSAEDISTWLERSANAAQEPFSSPGLGQDVRIEGEYVLGASLVLDDHPIHMELFHRPKLEKAAPTRER